MSGNISLNDQLILTLQWLFRQLFDQKSSLNPIRLLSCINLITTCLWMSEAAVFSADVFIFYSTFIVLLSQIVSDRSITDIGAFRSHALFGRTSPAVK